MLSVLKKTIPYRDQHTHALVFLPDPSADIKKGVGIFTHGYTSHKGSILNWPVRLAEEGLPCILFDLPGHYLGNFSEVHDFDHFKSHGHELFEAAFNELQKNFCEQYPLYEHYWSETDFQVVLGGHSLGALLALKALALARFAQFKRTGICVGLGLPPQGVTHIFQTPFYKSTLNIRAQLVSPALAPEAVLPWIREAKERLEISGERIHMITGKDDLVVGSAGTERLAEVLRKAGCQVSLEKPTKLPHTSPEMAAGLIKRFLRQQEIL